MALGDAGGADVEELKALFRSVADSDGSISTDDLRTIFRSLDAPFADKELVLLLAVADEKGRGRVEVDAFFDALFAGSAAVSTVAPQPAQPGPTEELASAWHELNEARQKLEAEKVDLDRSRRELAEEAVEMRRRDGAQRMLDAARVSPKSGMSEYVSSPHRGKPLHVRCDSSSGHALGKLLRLLSAKAAMVSAPEQCPSTGTSGTNPGDSTQVAPVLEQLVGHLFPGFVPAFAGASSRKECEQQEPDRSMSAEEWREPASVRNTQMCRYWMGRVRATLTTLVLGARPLQTETWVLGSNGYWFGLPKSCRIVFAFSMTGGPITQTEFSLLPSQIKGTVADVTTREFKMGHVFICWIHFANLCDLLKALQGYGGIDLFQAMDLQSFDLPGEWRDGEYNEAYDLLRDVPGATPDDRREYLLRVFACAPLEGRLFRAIESRSADAVRDLLAQRADPNAEIATHNRLTALHLAVDKASLDVVKALLEARADPSKLERRGLTPLDYMQKFVLPTLPTSPARVREKAAEIASLFSTAA